MSQLQYEARKNASVYKIPKVYFCCHPMDFDAYYKTISGELLAKQNCSVWHHGNKPAVYDEEFFADLGQMQLFVIPVTRRFLEPGSLALEKEFRFAMEHHIPVLPLMQERGLEAEFNRLCGNIQFLDKYNTDSTCIEYTDKLEKFLASVLVGDEMSRKIREAFEAYIFLSYRKKDRHHAQLLMKLIHDNEFCRDVAIWYDEFLVPGEDFNEAIEEALRKSKLFLLMVTPNLINEENYIMGVEFPMAKKHGKTIIPFEMEETDKAVLAEKYDGIPECTDARDSELLTQCLRQHFAQILSGKRNSTPEHLFLIGIAYLNGIDVEVNREYALKLITDAAEQDLPEAINQLIGMYTSGIGVQIDELEAIRWYKKLAAVTLENYRKEQTFQTAMNHMNACCELARVLLEQKYFEEAIEYAEKLQNFTTLVFGDLIFTEIEELNIRRYMALADMLLGRIYHEMNDFVRAKNYFEASQRIFTHLNDSLENTLLMRNTCILYHYIAQLCKVRAEYTEALEYYAKALELQQYNEKMCDGEEHLLDQVLTMVRMCEILRLDGQLEEAQKMIRKALDLLDELMRVHSDGNYLYIKMAAMLSLAQSYRLASEFSRCLQICEAVELLEEQYLKEHGSKASYIHGQRMKIVVQVYFQLTDYEAVLRCEEQMLAALEEADMTHGSNIATGGAEQAVAYAFIGLSYQQARQDMDQALKYLKMAADQADVYVERGILCNLPDVILIYCNYGSVLQLAGRLEESDRYLQKVQAIYEQYPPKKDDLRELCGLYTFYMVMGSGKVYQERSQEAIEIYAKAEAYYKTIDTMFPASGKLLIRDYLQLLVMVAACYLDLEDIRTIDYYEKSIETLERIPEDQYQLQDWNIACFSAYQLSCIANGFFNRRNWKKRAKYYAQMLCKRYPEEYQQATCYEILCNTGIFP